MKLLCRETDDELESGYRPGGKTGGEEGFILWPLYPTLWPKQCNRAKNHSRRFGKRRRQNDDITLPVLFQCSTPSFLIYQSLLQNTPNADGPLRTNLSFAAEPALKRLVSIPNVHSKLRSALISSSRFLMAVLVDHRCSVTRQLKISELCLSQVFWRSL